MKPYGANMKKEVHEDLHQFVKWILGVGITLTDGRIEYEDVEAIACAVDNSLNLAASGSAAESLLRVGGESLQTECRERFPSGIRYGDVIVVAGGNLKCKKVMLTSMANHEVEDEIVDFEKELHNALSAILENAIEKKVSSIAIPAIGIGKMGLSAETVTDIYYDCVKMKKSEFGSLKNIQFVLYDKPVFKEFESHLFRMHGDRGNTILHLACIKGDTEKCQYITDTYPSLVHTRDDDGYHILHHTAASGSVDCLQRITDIVIQETDMQHRELYLLECLTNKGETILHISSLKGKTETCQYIVDNYPNIMNIRNNDGYHILHHTASSGSVDCLQRITDIVIQETDMQHRELYMLKCLTYDGGTILHIACVNGETEMCQEIVNNYPSLINIRDNDGYHILHYTAASDSVACLQQIADIVLQDKDKQHREDYMLKCLTNDGKSILLIASLNEKTEMCQHITDTYPRLINIRDDDGRHILHHMAASGSVDCLQRITDTVLQDKDIQHRELYMLECLTNKGETILHIASLTGKTEMCQYIVDNYPNIINIRDNDGCHILHHTASSGSVDCLQQITDIVLPDKDKQHREQYMLKCLTNDGETVLHIACANGKTEMCHYLFDNYPNLVNIRDKKEWHILHSTASSGSSDILQLIADLIIEDKDKQQREQYMLNCLTSNGKTILHIAGLNGETGICQCIMDNYPRIINIRDRNGHHFLHDTAESGSVDCLQRVTDIVIPDTDRQHREQYMLKCLTNKGKTILHSACGGKKTEMCQYIIDTYPSIVNIRSNDGCHMFHYMAALSSVDCLQRITDMILLDKDKQHREQYMLKLLNNEGKTILHTACLHGKTEMCEYIMDNYPSLVNTKDNDGHHILHETMLSSSLQCLQRIIDIVLQDKDEHDREQYMLECLTNKGKTILHTACLKGKTEMCKYIVDHYPSLLNIKGDDGHHILHYAVASDSVECLQRITDIVLQDKDKHDREQYMMKCLTNQGSTILHIACQKGKTEMCQYIVDNHPSLINIRDNNGCNILLYTAESGSVDCLKLIADIVIKDKGKNHREQYMLECLSNDCQTILHFACAKEMTEICEYIVDTYPSLVNIRDNNGLHILHLTVASGSVDWLQRITDMVIQDKDQEYREQYMLKCLTSIGGTILHIACRFGKTEMIQNIADNYPGLVNIRDTNGWHIFHHTAASGSVKCLQRITDIVIPDTDRQHREQYMLKCLTNKGKTILHSACSGKKTEMCQYIIDTYPSIVNIRSNDGCHMFHYMAALSSVDCLQRITDMILLDKDKQHREQYMLKLLNNEGKTILHTACLHGKTEMCEYIMDNYPSLVNTKDNDGHHILHETMLSSSLQCLQRIIDIVLQDKDEHDREQYMLECLTNKGKTILHTACLKGKTEMCKYIVDHYPSLLNIKGDDGHHILHYAVASDSVECLQRITDIVLQDKDKHDREQYMMKCLTNQGSTILHIACQKGKTEMCQYIVDNHPSLINIRDNNGCNILLYTAESGSVDCLKLIADIVIKDKGKNHREQYMLECLSNDCQTILHFACAKEMTEICEYIVDTYPSLVNIRDNNGLHILHLTVASGSVDWLQRITDMVIQDKDQEYREQYMLKCLTSIGGTILHIACRFGKTEMIQNIADNYPGLVNIRDTNGWHIFHHTAASGSVKCLQRITDIVIPDTDRQHREQYMLKCLTNKGKTILHSACSGKKTEMCQYIIDTYPSIVNIRSNDGCHMFHYMAALSSVDCLQRITDMILLDKDKQHREQYMLKLLNNEGKTILHTACLHGKTEMCEYIMDNYPSLVNTKDNDGHHILHETMLSSSLQCLQRIIDIVLQDKDEHDREQYMLECLTNKGKTILHTACLKGKTEMCKYIVDHYPSLLNIKGDDGLHILHYAVASDSVECLQRITDIVLQDKDKHDREQYMMKCLTNQGSTILHIACQKGKTEMCQYIVDNHPSLINIRDNNGCNILLYTAESGSVDCLKLIADIVIKDKGKNHREQYMLECLSNDCQTILHFACAKEMTEICEYIVDTYPSLVNIRDNNGLHILHLTVASGSVDWLQRITDMVIQDKDQKYREQYMLKCLTSIGGTILHIACRSGKTEMIQNIADNYPGLVNIRDTNGWHIFHYTAASGSVKCLQRITDIVIPDTDRQHREQYMLKCLTSIGGTILHIACRLGKTEMIQNIADNYPGLVNIRDTNGWHIFHHTAASGSVKCLQRITDIVIPDTDRQHREQYMLKCLTSIGGTILHIACRFGKTEMIQNIADNYPGLVNIRDTNGWHICHHTAASESVNCLQRITDIVIPDKDRQYREQYMLKCLTSIGGTILHIACRYGKTEMIQNIAVMYPGLVNIRDNNGWHILHTAAASVSVDCLQQIIHIVIQDKDQEHREQYMLKCLTSIGGTILHIACCNGKTDVCQYIVDNYPSLVNIRDNAGCHILHNTAASGSVSCLQRITDRVIQGKDRHYREQYMLKCVTRKGFTILNIAINHKKKEMCQYIADTYPNLVKRK